MDGRNVEVGDINAIDSSYFTPSFLKNVFMSELAFGENHKLLLVAIHAVLLESGLTGFDMDLQTEIKGFQFSNNWPKNNYIFMLSLFYTLPGIIGHVIPTSEYQNGVVILKFQSTGNIVNVYGSLYSASTRTYLLRSNEDLLVPSLKANCGLGGEKIDGTELFNFWKNVKDKLALPLLIDLCDRVRAGGGSVLLPQCFMMSLPSDLKLKILELLPGDDIAKVSCVCSELRFLASNDDIWKLKIVKEFDGSAGTSDQRGDWKRKFAMRWQRRRSMKEFDGAQRIIHRIKRFRGLR